MSLSLDNDAHIEMVCLLSKEAGRNSRDESGNAESKGNIGVQGVQTR